MQTIPPQKLVIGTPTPGPWPKNLAGFILFNEINKMNRLSFILVVITAVISPAFIQAQLSPDSTVNKPGQQPGSDSLPFRQKDSLKQVTVTASRSGVQVDNGRIIMNMANSALAAGATVFDVLTKMPGVSVGQDDNLSLRGTQNVTVMIDGKMNYLTGKQLADLLKGMSSEQIVRIELMPTPPAAFDAAGNAGIINIITRKHTARGYAIDLRSTLTRGSNWLFNENITAAVNTRRLQVSASFDYNTPHRFVNSHSGNGVQEHGLNYNLQRTNTGSYKIKFYTYRLGADWQLNDRHQLSAFYHGYFDDFSVYKHARVNRYDADDQLHSVIRTHTSIIEPYHYHAGNISYTWRLDTAGRKLTAEGHYINYRNLSDGLMTTRIEDGNTGSITAEHALRSHQPGYITIRSAKADLEWPYKGVLLRAGLKYAHVTNDNNFRFDSLINGSYKEAATMSDHFLYDEKIAAAYVSLAKQWKRSGLQAGLRMEQTDAGGRTVKAALFNQWKYTRFFPTISFEHTLKQHRLSLSLSRRINRPAYGDLNPVRWYVDQYFYYAGNPGLVPEMAWLLAATGTFNRKYVVTATYGLRENYMAKRLLVDSASNAVKSQSVNFSDMQRFDLLLAAPFSAGWWSLQASVGVNYSMYPIPQRTGDVSVSRWAGSVQVQQQVKLPAGLRLEVSTNLYSRELWGIYLKEALFFSDAGLQKAFLNENLLLKLSFTDFLRTYRLKAYSLSNTTDYRYFDRPDMHRLGLSVRYHIGGKVVPKKAAGIEEQERL
ncbi:outer membrane beta-barrel protein [Longitalea luteola]|uniref:outer membrane beta-barrel protein n=1 Tax=Longitalea luteola TaxID=2812563 RepID=UPI001A979868|nr:outer membrane beta-barrel protein [Longitalea luteola]